MHAPNLLLAPPPPLLASFAVPQLGAGHPLTLRCAPPAAAAPVLPQVEQATRSTNKSLQRLVSKLQIKPEDIYAALCSQTVDLVFTAHPTQARHHGCTAQRLCVG